MDRRVRSELLDIVGPAGLITDPDTVAPYLVDWTGRFRGRGDLVLRPGSVAEVAAVVELCRRVAYLPLQRSAAELSAMRAVKSALDPGRIMNPNTLVP